MDIAFTQIDLPVLLSLAGALAALTTSLLAFRQISLTREAERELVASMRSKHEAELLIHSLKGLRNRSSAIGVLERIGESGPENFGPILVESLSQDPPDPVLLRVGELVIETGASMLPADQRDQILDGLRQPSARGRANYIVKLLAEGLDESGTGERSLDLKQSRNYQVRQLEDQTPLLKQASLLEGLGRTDEALALYQKALAQDSQNPEILYSMSSLLAERGRVEEALVGLYRAVAVAPDQPRFWTTLGSMLQQSGRYEEALDAYDRAVQLSP